MNKKEVLGGYQDDATNPNVEGKAGVDEQKAREEREQVEEVLGMPGYMILHRMFIERITESVQRLQNPALSEKELRFEQGVVGGLTSVQRRFVGYHKEYEGGKSDE